MCMEARVFSRYCKASGMMCAAAMAASSGTLAHPAGDEDNLESLIPWQLRSIMVLAARNAWGRGTLADPDQNKQPWTRSIIPQLRGAAVLAVRLEVREQALKERVPSDGLRVAHQRAVPARACDRDIHAAPHRHALGNLN